MALLEDRQAQRPAEDRRARRRGDALAGVRFAAARFGRFVWVRAGGIVCGPSFDARPRASCLQPAFGHLPCGGVTAPILRASGLVKTFGQGRAARRVLDGAGIEVAAGELVAVVGRSGSGKSTLLHLLGGLDRAEAGAIELAGERVDGRPERELARLRARHVGFVFQFFHLVPELSGAENVALAARLPGAAPDAAQRGRELLDRLGLADAAGRMPARALRRRAAAGRARAGARQRPRRRPRRRADRATSIRRPRRTVLAILREVAAEGRAVVLVTHEEAATAAATRILRLRDGVLAV